MNLLIVGVIHPHHVHVTRELEALGFCTKAIVASKWRGYWSGELSEFISERALDLILMEDFHFPEAFDKVLDPDYSIVTQSNLEKISYYSDQFRLSLDRLCFHPISQVQSYRYFHRFLAHFYNKLKKNSIEGIVIIGIPHGLISITLQALARLLKIKCIHVTAAGPCVKLSILESDITPARGGIKDFANSRSDSDFVGRKVRYDDYIESNRPFVDDLNNISQSLISGTIVSKKGSRLGALMRQSISALIKNPLSGRFQPGFYFNENRRSGALLLWDFINYFYSQNVIGRFYEVNSIRSRLNLAESAEGADLAVACFLHMQPEASTVPLCGIYADQLLMVDTILQGLPASAILYVKEHPLMFTQFCQDRHDRSVSFYKHLLRDSRVRLVSRRLSSSDLLAKVRLVVTGQGTVGWEAIRLGKPAINFGWSWYGECESSYQVTSVESFREALSTAIRKDEVTVRSDARKFLRKLIYERAVDAPADAYYLHWFDRREDFLSHAHSLAKSIEHALN